MNRFLLTRLSSPYKFSYRRSFRSSLMGNCFSTSQDRKSSAEGQPPVFQCDEEPNVLGTDKGWGFLPLSLGQEICDGRFRIIRKLGWGGHSTVWLAREPRAQRYVAIKTLTAHATRVHNQGHFEEIQLLERIRSTNPRHPGFNHCCQLLDTFRVTSEQGEHLCLVTEVLGADLDQYRQRFAKRRLPIPVVKRLTKQMLLALDYLHQECGIIHTDLKPQNTLLALGAPDEAISAEIERVPSELYPPRYDKSLRDGPIITVKSQPLITSDAKDDGSNLSIKIADFGHASWVDRQLRDEIQPLALRAPEVVIGYPWGTSADIWSLGCLIFEYLAGVCLIPLQDADKLKIGTRSDALLARILQTSTDSEYPNEMIAGSSQRQIFFTPEGLLRRVRPGPKTDLAAVLRRFGIPEDEISPALNIIYRCIRVKPEDRPTAQELLQDPWLEGI